MTPYRILCNGTQQKSPETRPGLILEHSRNTSLHKIRYGITTIPMPGKTEPLIIVDADAIISFVYIDDRNHARAKAIMQQLATLQGSLLFPTTAICEAVTVLRGKLNRPDDARRIVKKFQSGDFPVQSVDHEILGEAADLFHPLASKKNTLFDAVVAAIAKKLNADAIFSFDGWYRKIGLSLTDDLIEHSKEAE